jgi:hypothetical protein
MVTKRSTWIAVAAMMLLGLLTSPRVEARIRHAESDSTTTVSRISIGRHGIVIDGPGASSVIRKRIREHLDDDADFASSDSTEFDTVTVGHRTGVALPGLSVEGDESDLVRVFSDVEVPADQRIEGDVVAVFGSVRIDGQVNGNVVAVFGSVRLMPGSSVDGDAVAVGGALDQAPNARVRGESVSLGFLPVHWGMPALRGMLGVLVVGWMITLLVGWLFTLIFPTRMLRVAVTASRRVVASFFLGILSAPLLVIAVVLMMITLIGIPLALLLPLFYVMMVWAGQIASSYVLGSRLLHRRLGEAPPMMAIGVGTLFVGAFFVLGAAMAGPEGAGRSLALFFSLLGGLMVIGLSIIGVGAVLLSRFGSRPRDFVFESHAPAASGTAPGSAPPLVSAQGPLPGR